MAEAYISDAVHSPRGHRQRGKSALLTIPYEPLFATMFAQLSGRDRLDAVLHGGGIGRIAALDASYDVRAMIERV